jgi:predicted nucleic acid-binding protein
MFVVLDTSVLVDIFLTSNPRHAKASGMKRLIASAGLKVRLPAHGMFELAAAMKQQKISANGRALVFNPAISEADPLHIEPVAVDEKFFEDYFSVDLPYLKGGDLIFVALAKGDGIDLVTEDKKQYAAAKQAGVSVFDIEEYILHLQARS